ncbi:activating transcription factor 7-interacting protein 2 [Discoglossus pictus]
MEAANGEGIAGDTAPLKTDTTTNPPAKKIYRARKTMTASCREQIAAIHKIKNDSQKESSAKEPNIFFPKQTIQQEICKTNYFAQENSTSKLSKSLACDNQGLFPNGLKVSIEVSQIDSGINIGCSYKETWSPNQKSQGIVSPRSGTPDEDSIHITRTERFVVEQPKSPLHAPPLENLRKSTNSSPNVESTMQAISRNSTPSCISEADVSKDISPLSDTLVNRVLDPATTFCSVKSMANSDLEVVMTNTTEAKDQSSDPTCTTDSPSPNDFTLNLSEDSSSEDISSPCSPSGGFGKRKRPCSESDKIDNCKRNKPSDQALPEKKPILEQIQCLIETRMQSFFKDVFEQRMEDLTQRVNLIQAKGANREEVDGYIQRVKKLEKRVKSALRIQRDVAQPKNLDTSRTNQDGTKATDLNLPSSKNLSNSEATTAPANSQTGKPDATRLIVLSDSDSEEKSSSHKKTLAHDLVTSLQQTPSSNVLALSKNLESSREKQAVSTDEKRKSIVIDLTAEENQQDQDTRLEGKISATSQNDTAAADLAQKPADLAQKPADLAQKPADLAQKPADLAQKPADLAQKPADLAQKPADLAQKPADLAQKPADLAQKPADLAQKPAEAKLPSLKSIDKDVAHTSLKHALEVAQSSESPDIKPPVNTLKVVKPPDPIFAPKSSSECVTEMGKIPLPQKPELRLTQVKNPKGIALSWDITNVDPDCAPVQYYCLYVHQEDPNNPKVIWKKIGEIRALPLPMACTLTQFIDGTKYSFAMRARDIYGRFGPLCDIQSTTLLPSPESVKNI